LTISLKSYKQKRPTRAATRIGLETKPQSECDMAKYDLPPVEYLRECFLYDPETGDLRWRNRPREHFTTESKQRAFNTRFAGATGTEDNLGYLHFGVTYRGALKRIKAHRIAYALITGRTGFRKIDHANQNRKDNRARNLREATNSQNMANRGKLRSTGLPKGVSYHQRQKKFQATTRNGGKTLHLGYFSTPKEAHAAYVAFVKPIHGEFFNPGVAVDTIFD
jgi:hypothetical protein